MVRKAVDVLEVHGLLFRGISEASRLNELLGWDIHGHREGLW